MQLSIVQNWQHKITKFGSIGLKMGATSKENAEFEQKVRTEKFKITKRMSQKTQFY